MPTGHAIGRRAGRRLVGSLFLLQPVEVTGADRNGFVPCRAEVQGRKAKGYAHHSFLREPVSPRRQALLAQVHREYLRFQRGLGLEHVAPFSTFVGEMWQALGLNLDGTDRDVP